MAQRYSCCIEKDEVTFICLDCLYILNEKDFSGLATNPQVLKIMCECVKHGKRSNTEIFTEIAKVMWKEENEDPKFWESCYDNLERRFDGLSHILVLKGTSTKQSKAALRFEGLREYFAAKYIVHKNFPITLKEMEKLLRKRFVLPFVAGLSVQRLLDLVDQKSMPQHVPLQWLKEDKTGELEKWIDKNFDFTFIDVVSCIVKESETALRYLSKRGKLSMGPNLHSITPLGKAVEYKLASVVGMFDVVLYCCCCFF